MVARFKSFLKEAATQQEYSDLLDDVMSLLDSTGGQMIYVKKNGDEYHAIEISGENYVESTVKNGDKEIIKTNKLFKDGNIVNYDLAVSRLKEFKKAIENEQFVPMPEQE